MTGFSTHRRLHLAAALLWLLYAALSGCATTPSVEPPDAKAEFQHAYSAGDYRSALRIAVPLAKGGEPWAEYAIGYMTFYGQGVAQDRAAGEQWIARAAAKDYEWAREAMRRIAAARQAEAAAPAADAPVQPSDHEATAQPLQRAQPAAVGAAHLADDAPRPEPAPATAVPQEITTAAAMLAADAEPAPEAAEPEAAAAPAVQHSPEEPIRDNAWVMDQDPDRFTIQLVSTGSREAVLRFLREHDLERSAAYFSSQRDGQSWYSVIYGSYPDSAQASAALGALPDALRKAKPWIRRLGEIQRLAAGQP